MATKTKTTKKRSTKKLVRKPSHSLDRKGLERLVEAQRTRIQEHAADYRPVVVRLDLLEDGSMRVRIPARVIDRVEEWAEAAIAGNAQALEQAKRLGRWLACCPKR